MPVTMFSFMYTFFMIFASHKRRLIHVSLWICHINLVLFSVYLQSMQTSHNYVGCWFLGFFLFKEKLFVLHTEQIFKHRFNCK